MAIKVLITREFKKDKIDEALKLLKELRAVVTLQPGYISGQTLVGADNPNRIVVVSTWTSNNRWDAWRQGQHRKEFSGRLGDLLDAPEQVEVFFAGAPAEE